jgi:hypothetical protein
LPLSNAKLYLQRFRFDRTLEPTREDGGACSEGQRRSRCCANHDPLELVGEALIGVTERSMNLVDQVVQNSTKAAAGIPELSGSGARASVHVGFLGSLRDVRELLSDSLEPHQLLDATPSQRHLPSLTGRGPSVEKHEENGGSR